MRSQIASKQSGAFGERLRKLRTQKGLSQKQVADLIDVPKSTYRDWEYGKQIVGEPYVILAEALGVSLTELLTGQKSFEREILLNIDELEKHIRLIRKAVASL